MPTKMLPIFRKYKDVTLRQFNATGRFRMGCMRDLPVGQNQLRRRREHGLTLGYRQVTRLLSGLFFV
jgi:hypothetical protein